MIPGAFKCRAELAALAVLLIVGGWNVEALVYMLGVILLALISAAAVDVLLRAVCEPRPVETAMRAGNPWLVAAFALISVVMGPGLVLGEFAPPLALLFYPIFLAYFGGPFIREYVQHAHREHHELA